MNLLTDSLKPLYYKYLSAAFGSALIASIYMAIDMALVGQDQGPAGMAALAVVAPVWNVIYSLGLLTGIGGAVLFSLARVDKVGDATEGDRVFTVSLLLSVILAGACWAALLVGEDAILRFFGADDALLPLARDYLKPIRYVFPVFLLNQWLAAFLRNDGSPLLATLAVLGGGVVNSIGDYVFIFPCGMGIYGAGLATALGGAFTLLFLAVHFFLRRSTLRLVVPRGFGRLAASITSAGFSPFFVDLSMGVLTFLFNRQIMHYLGTDALAVYGVIINLSTFVQCCAYSVGQAAQPILSANFGAGKRVRERRTLRFALASCAVISLVWLVLVLAAPNLFVRLFMDPTENVLAIAPAILRAYALSFLFLPLNVYSTYHFQSILQSRSAMVVSLARGLILSGALILLLPLLTPAALWYAMPLAETLVAVYVIREMKRHLPRPLGFTS